MLYLPLVAILLQLNIFNTQSLRIGFQSVSHQINSPQLQQLKYYELLEVKDVRRKVRSAIDGHVKVHFSAFNRSFDLMLTQSKHLISSKFKAYEVNAKGVKKPITVDFEEFYEGLLLGHENTNVTAHIDGSSGLLTAAIHNRTENEVYFVEPYWRHTKASDAINNHSNSVLIYRSSDVRHSVNLSHNVSFCESVNIKKPSSVSESDINAMKQQKLERRKRSDGSEIIWDEQMLPNSRCALILVADYLFYESVGAKSMKHTINYLIALIGRINVLFTETTFSDSEDDDEAFKDYGFTIQEILVHREPSDSEYYLYNTYNKSWTPMDLLDVFSREKNHESFCLAHLFTRRNFHPTLGMAYVASPKKDAIGGICSRPEYKSNSITTYPNTGFTTTVNKFESQLTTSELDLVTAHELGHSWGAQHDPDIEECSPSNRNGGAYIMYYYTISGREKNNRYFSPCSRRAIKAVLKSKADFCFIKPSTSFCGNGVIEEGEECDAGLIMTSAKDMCCTYDCKLKLGADCSDQNEPCCNRCKYVQSGVKCRDEHELVCLSEAYCTGYSGSCPKSGYLDDGTDCLDRGKCVAGKCQPFCETKNLHSCVCENSADACKRCCSVSPLPNVTCIPYNETDVLTDGTPCIRGYCERGICKHSGRDIAHRFWHIIQTHDVNAFALFMKDNIVGTIIVLSIIIWIPICCLIKILDRRQLKRTKNKRAIRERVRLVRQENLRFDGSVPSGQNGVRFKLEVYQADSSDSD